VSKKRLILLLDGTWNDADSGTNDTNIVRLRELIATSLDTDRPFSKHRFCADDATAKLVSGRTFGNNNIEHLVFYARGVGTDSTDSLDRPAPDQTVPPSQSRFLPSSN
jgi:uncharacterized protein (DUF2235 family)